MSSPGNENPPSQTRPATAACKGCRKLKISKELARQSHVNGANAPTDPVTFQSHDRLEESGGATGRYHGIDKAYRKLQSELKKVKASHGNENSDDLINLVPGEEPMQQLLGPSHPAEPHESTQSPLGIDNGESSALLFDSGVATLPDEHPGDFVSPGFHNDEISHSNQEPISNPLGLLADASDAAQALELHPTSSGPSPMSNVGSSMTHHSANPADGAGFGRQLLHRPGYVSLGLQLGRDTLEAGIDAILAPPENFSHYSNYFKSPPQVPQRDVGPDVDPVDLGLVTMEEAYRLFPIYYARLHPVNGILDPMLHTPDFVRSRSALLFTWIIALTAQFDHDSASIAKRLRLHGEKLSRHVHTCGYKSVEIVQGYYISLLSATPAKTLEEERSWLYTTYALGVAADLGLDQDSRAKDANPLSLLSACHVEAHDMHGAGYFSEDTQFQQRLARNRERTWLRILLWERANSASCGRIRTFPETDLTQSIDSWWRLPLADPTDKHTCAFITLRRGLASLQSELRQQAHLTHQNPHWVRELVDMALRPWCDLWLSQSVPESMTSPSEKLSNIFLHYVYLHGRLWTLSFALHSSINRGRDLDAIRADCFEAAVHCCELAVRDLQTIGEPLYCMLAPTWAMISYAGVLALKLFPALFGSRAGNDIELLALLSQVAMQLQRAGTTPSHRTGIAALLGQHLMMILRARTVGLKDSPHPGQTNSDPPYYQGHYDGARPFEHDQSVHALPSEALVSSDYDPFLMTASMSTQGDLTGEGFAEFFRETFGLGFGGVF